VSLRSVPAGGSRDRLHDRRLLTGRQRCDQVLWVDQQEQPCEELRDRLACRAKSRQVTLSAVSSWALYDHSHDRFRAFACAAR